MAGLLSCNSLVLRVEGLSQLLNLILEWVDQLFTCGELHVELSLAPNKLVYPKLSHVGHSLNLSHVHQSLRLLLSC